MPADDRFVVRPESVQDHDEIARVVTAAFGSPAEARLVEAIRASAEYIADLALVATLDDAVVGQSVPLHRAPRRRSSCSRPGRRSDIREGVGAPRHAATSLADAQANRSWCSKATRYYSRFGFLPASSHGIELPLPDWAPAAAAQVKPLTNDDPTLRGTVVYPASFDVLGDH